MSKTFAVVGVIVLLFGAFSCVALAAAGESAATDDVALYEDRAAQARSTATETYHQSGIPAGRVTYILKEIPRPSTSMNSITFRGYINFDPTLSLSSINVASAGANYNYIRCYNSSTHVFDMYVGDYFTADPEWNPSTTAQQILDEYFEVVEWLPDTTSVFNNVRSTMSHYLFNDDFSNVSFGSGWVDLFSTLITFIVFLVPVFVCFACVAMIWRLFER